MRLTVRRVLARFAPIALAAVAACSSPTAPTVGSVEQQRARFSAFHLTKYEYTYYETGFLNNISGHHITVFVIADTVRSAWDQVTSDTVPVGLVPTLDQLFDIAIASAANHSLTAITYDANFFFPSRMDIAGPPDAGGSIFASGVFFPPAADR